MIKNLTIGVLNIVTGSGTLASLKKFWTTCQNSKSSYDETVRNEVPDFDLYESLIQIVSGKNVVADQKIWFQDSLTQNSKDERCEISSKAFLKKFNISFEALRNQSINNLIIGSFKEISCGNWQVVALLLGNTENDMHHELYAELTDWSNNSRLTDIKESFDEDHLHEWTLSPDCCNEFQSIVGKNRTGTSLSSYCALNVNITGAEIHGWLESFARASLALRHRILPGGKKHTTDFIPPADYVIFEKKSPWICSPKQSASASCFLRNSHFFSIIRLRESKLSRKPRFIEDEGDLFVFSADQKEEFYITLKQFNDLIKISKDQDIGLMAKNLGCRKPGRYRAAIVASDKHDLIEKLDKMIAGIVKTERSLPRLKYGNVWNLTGILEPKIAGVFPGQGTQRFQMLRELCMRFPEIRDWFDNLDEAMVDVVGILPSLSIFPPSDGLSVDERQKLLLNLYSQEGGSTAVIVASIALNDLLHSFGCFVNILLGHSSGEISAMITSGSLKFESKKELFATILSISKKGVEGDSRGEIPKGKFLAVTIPDETILTSFIQKNEGNVFLAIDNCPQQKVLFCLDLNFEAIYTELIQLGAICIPLYFDRAYHTRLFEVEMPFIRSVYDSFNILPPEVPIFSCIKLANYPHDAEKIKEWAALNWTHCVRFKEACQILSQKGIDIFLEIGPGGALSGFIDNTLTDHPHKALQMDREGYSSYTQLLHVLANLFVEGVNLNLQKLFEQDDDSKPVVTGFLPDAVFSDVKTNVGDLFTPAINNKSLPADQQIPPSHFRINQDSKSMILQQHFAFMNEYIEMESRILDIVLKHQSQKNTASNYSAPPIIADPGTATHNLNEIQVHDLPMIDSVISKNKRQCISKRIISREKDLFLQHHSLGRFTLKMPKDTVPLPVVPLALTIEMLAEAACLMAPASFVVTEISNVRALRWMTIDDDCLALLLYATLVSETIEGGRKIQVNVISEINPEQIFCTAIVTLKAGYSQSEKPMQFSAEVPTSPLWNAESFFEECLFHGEAFSCLDKLLRLGKEEIEVGISIPRRDMLFLGQEFPEFKTPAQLLDVAGHMTAYHKVEMGDKLFGIFPVSINRIQFFDPEALPHSRFLGRSKNNQNRMIVETELEVLNPNNSVYMKMSGLQQVYYRFDSSFLNSHYWTSPNTYYSTELLIEDPDIIAFEAKSLTDGFLEQSGGLWLRSLVNMFCNSKEKQDWQNLPEKGRRRQEWLLGRIAAKEIVRKWALHLHFIYIVCPDIEIGYDSDGRPFVSCAELELLGPLPDISITHSGMHAIAIATNPGSRMGVDLEYFSKNRGIDSQKPQQHLEIAFSPEEMIFFRKRGDADLLTLVSAKEAVSKAIGIGLLGTMKLWKIKEYNNDIAQIEIMSELIPVTINQNEGRILTFCIIPTETVLKIRTRIYEAHPDLNNSKP